MHDFDVPAVFMIFVFSLIGFFILRIIFLWYLKINERVRLQREQNLLMRKLLLYLGDEKPNEIGILTNEGIKKENIKGYCESSETYNLASKMTIVKIRQ
ncbi:MAG: hypothetical protein ACR2FN_00345 [Chitinophagaceae bacterium]